MIKTITPGAAYLHPAISSIYLGTVNPDDHSRFGFTDYIGNFLGPDTPLMDALILLYEPDPDASYWETAAAAGALRRLLSDVGLGRLDQLNGEHAVSLTDSEVHHPDRVRLVWDRKTLAGVYGTKEGAAVHLSRLGKHGKISENLLVDYNPTKVFFPCPHLKQEPNMTTQPEKEPATPSDFIEGAAYVSPSRNQLYLCEQHSDEAALILHSVGRWEYAKIGNPKIPDDLVMIWAPGDEPPARVTRRPSGGGLIDLDISGVEPGNYIEPFTVEFGTTDHFVPLEPDQVFQNPEPTVIIRNWATSEWHYPPRLNSRPGRYEDETGQEWLFHEQAGENVEFQALHWESGTTGNSWHMVPIDQFGERIAVKWIGELDE